MNGFGKTLAEEPTDNTQLRFAIGIVGDAGVRGTAQQPRLFVGMILILIFAEVLGPCITSPLPPSYTYQY